MVVRNGSGQAVRRVLLCPTKVPALNDHLPLSIPPGEPDSFPLRLVRANLKNPFPLIAFILAILVWGSVAFENLPRDVFPRIPIPVVMVATFYPGMNATQVERNITSLMERQFTMAGDVESIHSRSLNGISLIKVIFHSRVPINEAVSEISELSLSLLSTLPPGTLPPMIISYSFSNVPVCHVLLTSDSLSQSRLYDIAANILRPQLGGIAGVSAPPIFGGKVRQISLYLHPDQLINRHLTPLDIVNAIYRQNILIPTGNIRIGTLNYFTRFNSQVPDLAGIRDIPVTLSHRVPVFVKDIADVEDSFAPQENLVLVDRKPSVVLPIYREAGYSALSVVETIRKSLPLLDKIPREVKMTVLFDQTLYIREALSSLLRETLLGILASALFIFLILGDLRLGILAVLALPMTYLAVLIFLRVTGETVNIMTLGGLAIAVGPMIDHLVLVIESLKSHALSVEEPPDGLVRGIAPVLTPTIIATLAMISVFVPLFFLTGLVHDLFKPLAVSVIGANLFSLILSVTLLPWLVYLSIRYLPRKIHQQTTRNVSRMEKAFDLYRNRLGRLLEHPVLLLSSVSLIIGLCLSAFYFIRINLYPGIDSGQFRIYVHFPAGNRLSRSKAEASRIDQLIRQELPPGAVDSIVSNIGIKAGWSSMFNPNAGTDTAIVDVALISRSRRNWSTSDAIIRLKKALRNRFPSSIFIFKPAGIIEDLISRGRMAPITVEIHGDNLAQNLLFAKRLAHAIRDLPGVVSSNVFQRSHYPILDIQVDRVLSDIVGTDVSEVSRNVLVALNSNNQIHPVPWIDPSTGFFYFLSVLYPTEFFQRMDDLNNLAVAHTRGRHITLLGELARIHHADEPEEITHDRLDRAIDILVIPSPGRSITVSSHIGRLIRTIPQPYGIHARFVGMTRHIRSSFSGMRSGMVLAIFFLFLLLMVFYRSFLAPAVILGVVPLSVGGSVFLLWVTRSSLNLVSMMGILMTVGIATSNSILLLNRYLELERRGLSLQEAILTGSRERIRPVIITSFSAIFAMVPVSFSWWTGSDNTIPLARAVIGGLGIATPLTLVVIPVIWHQVRKPRPPVLPQRTNNA
ncbi:efflux transporter periplasmic adaptor subunit [Leptospirillum ferriphilum]|uniref:Efflux transporter periplasmic adaptor subunit n=2 Tax=Leptospirillum ferriphilum TaxID=178606 RepID=A0A1V3ST91_9BACT|nr:acriflavin resistance protein [Leptospirillum ferriphilum ML-04]OOH69763.1 efflux transporter periplasmic adaptor subunit [Leptospirillum ferriphilum]